MSLSEKLWSIVSERNENNFSSNSKSISFIVFILLLNSRRIMNDEANNQMLRLKIV